VDALLSLWAVAAENDSRPIDTPEAIRILLARDPGACLVACEEERTRPGALADEWLPATAELAQAGKTDRPLIGQAKL
jgi:hypothetical protein